MHHAGIYWSLFAGLITGGGGVRFLVYVSKAMPPCPSSASWFAQFFYNVLKNTSGLDPSSAIISQNTLSAMGLTTKQKMQVNEEPPKGNVS